MESNVHTAQLASESDTSRIGWPLIAGFWCLVFAAQIPSLIPYFERLVEVPAYAWHVPSIVLCGFIVSFAIRWDRKLWMPTHWFHFAMLFAGLSLSLLSATLHLQWLAIVAFAITLAAFSAAQRDRRSGSLVLLASLALALIIPPWGAFATIQGYLGTWVTDTSGNFLRFFRVTHIQFGSAIAIPDQRIEPEAFLHTWSGWPLFLSLALAHSAICRRGWAVTAVNALSSIAVCFFFHLGLVLVVAYLRELNTVIENPVWMYTGLSIAAALLFLSFERAARGILLSIPDGRDEGSNANPLVYFWNRLLAPKLDSRSAESQSNVAKETSSRSRPRNRAGKGGSELSHPQASLRTWWPKMAIAVSLCLCVFTIAGFYFSPIQRKTGTDTVSLPASVDLVANVWSNPQSLDHRSVSVWGAQADLWTYYLPNRVSSLSIESVVDHWKALPPDRATLHWNDIHPVENPEEFFAGGTPSIPIGIATMTRPNEHGLYFVAELKNANPQGESLIVKVVSALPTEPDQATKQAIASEFLTLLEELASNLNVAKG